MTHQELNEKFQQFIKLNPFELYIELKKFNKEYKKSQFYKETKLSIKKAYEMYVSCSVGNLISKVTSGITTKDIIDKITEIINGIDQDAIDDLMKLVKDNFNLNTLQVEKGELTDLLSQFAELFQ